ncbi:MAG: C1 family peptidase [candidate division WOR-3 bacterium]|nr:MAG: C1 family peptidase [candidate division WOR-3 bacterium]
MKRVLFLLVVVALVRVGVGQDREFGFGWIPERFEDMPDSIKVSSVDVAPGCANCDSVDSIDISHEMPPIGNQSSQGSCAAWAMGYYHKSHTEWLEDTTLDLADPHNQFSPAFIYNQVNCGVDGGSRFSHIGQLIRLQGCADLVDCPYNVRDYRSWPSESAYFNALPYRAQRGYSISTADTAGINMIKQRLCNGQTTVLGILCWSNFANINAYDTVYCVSDVTGSLLGGHGVCVTGYNDNKMTNDGPGAFRIANSWGTGWGSRGYFWMSYRAVMDTLTSGQAGYYMTDRIGYQPKLIARLKVSHRSRCKVGFALGAGRWSNPLWHQDFRSWRGWRVPLDSLPFPDQNIVLDMTEAESLLVTGRTDSAYVLCRDDRRDSVTGTIDFFQVEHLDSGWILVSPDPPVQIPDYLTAAFAVVTLNSGVASRDEGGRMKHEWEPATIVRDVLTLLKGMTRQNGDCPSGGGPVPVLLLDLAGREVMPLRPGQNDIRHVAPGVYFARTAERGRRSAVSKVVIQR